MSTTRTLNFSAGPAALPLPALERAHRELLDHEGTGSSLMEQSHRDAPYEKVHDEALALVRELLAVPDDYEVLFLQGGASQQFAMVPMTFLGAGARADYAVTGAWGEKAVAEAEMVAKLLGGEVRTVVSTGPGFGRGFESKDLAGTAGAAYVHVTSNETIHGVELGLGGPATFPVPADAGAPLVCDMSSDFLAREIDVTKFAMIYAGAQKNVGPSGVTVVVARKDFLERGRKDLPQIFQYRAFAKNKSLLNTPPTFGIYLMRNVLEWLRDQGGVHAIEQENRAKAKALYDVIDGSGGYYTCPVEPAYRSLMNVVFRLPDEAAEKRLLVAAKARNMSGLKGHRSVGGLRASIYNAVPREWVEHLAEFLAGFAKAG